MCGSSSSCAVPSCGAGLGRRLGGEPGSRSLTVSCQAGVGQTLGEEEGLFLPSIPKPPAPESLGILGTDKSAVLSCSPPPSFPASQALAGDPQSLGVTGSW